MLDSPGLRTALLGRDTTRSFLAFGLAIALALGFYVLGAIGEAQGWIYGFDQVFPVFVLLVLVVGGVVAAGNAYWNDGLVLSWLLVFGPVLGWLWIVLVQSANLIEVAIVPVAFATLGALVAGTLGYVAGRVLVVRADAGSWADPSNRLLRLLVGHVPNRQARWALLAGGLFVLSGALIYANRPYTPLPVEGVVLFELFYPTGVLAADTVFGIVVILAWMGLAAWPAYRREGILVSWGLPFGPLFGAILTDFVLGDTSGGGPWLEVAFAFIAALIFALVLGTGGYLLGSGLRWIADRNRPSAVKPDAGT